MNTTTTAAARIDALRSAIDGDAFAAGEVGWDEARGAWNLAVDQRPAAVALPESASDVATAVRWACSAGLRIAVQGTGHNPIPYGDLGDALLIKTGRMRRVMIDPEARIARVEAGAQWGDVVPLAAEHGLAALAGSSHDVGVVGYALGGGVSWLARRHGLAAESVRAIELVTADGREVRATPFENGELFWALRGGGGNFGVVTAIELGLFDEPEIYAGALFFPLERSGEVLRAWRAWTDTVPDEMTSIGRFIEFPELEIIPEPLRGNSFGVLEATFLGPEAVGADVIAPLRELGPGMDTFGMVGPDALLALHMDPPEPVPGLGAGGMLADLNDDVITAVDETIGAGTDSPLITFEFRHLGGALARRGTGALGSLDGAFLTYGAGMVTGPEAVAAITERLRAVYEALEPVVGGRPYMNFIEERTDTSAMFEPAAYERLRSVKAAVDPDGLFRGNHEIAAA
ncbi:MAG TPA: FAD-binding oxidoreductase [Solirubrobacterales bacterium]